MMPQSHCYCFFGIIAIYFSFLIHTLASATPHFCLHDQRQALLEFRDEFPIDELDPNPWNKSSTDCCFWKGVMCDDKSGQVISLALPFTFLSSSLKTNSSLFKLQYLRHLNLTGCNLQEEIPSSLGNLSRLTLVDLSHNNLSGEIPSSIGNLKRLKYVNLGANTLKGEIPASMGNLNHLKYLSLGLNELTGKIPSSLGNLSSLLYLQLSINQLVGEIPDSIGNLNELRVMSLGQNKFSGNIPISFTNLTKLYHISLPYNNFTSTLPSNMSVFHNLEHFDVSANSFYGSFPKSLFEISSLQVVYLEKNQFLGTIEFPNISSSSSSPKLEFLYLAHNKFDGLIPASISKFFNLGELNLCENNFSGTIPRSMSKLANLRVLDLSNNKLEGEVPGFLWRLTTMTLSHNFFTSLEKPSQETLIQALDMNSNSLQGPFPHWICRLKGLSLLDLSNNLFNGSIPPCLRNSIVSFTDLILRNNRFSGTLPDIFANATELRSFDVGRNQLKGNLPKSLINSKALQLVNVEGNKIKDKFPSWLGSLPSLHVLILRSNEFSGPLYHHRMSIGFQRLRIIDVSHNDFTGTLPLHYFSNWREMTTVTEEYEDYMADLINYSIYYRNSMEMVNKGVKTSFERIRQDFRAIDFSGNRLYGKIPESIGFLKELRLLNLAGNAFTSDIPRFLANLTKLETLDLSGNKLSGQIPQDLDHLSFLSYMNFSHNLLRGPVPRGTQFQRQECSSFLDNPGLYGLEEICPQSNVPNPASVETKELPEEEMFNWVAAAIAYGPGVFCGLVVGHIFTSHYHGWVHMKLGRKKLRVTISDH